jgi:PKD repeat protein
MFRGITRFGASCAFLVSAVAATGCDKVPLLAPTNSTVTLTAPTRTLPLGGTTEVTATVLESGGTPVQNGTTVRFTTSLGSVAPVEAQTRNGIATATFNAGTASGTAEIRATSGAAGGGTTSGTTTTTSPSNVLSITIGAAAAGRINLVADPQSVVSTGGTSQITATVFDTSGNALPGIPVSFVTDAGSLSQSLVTTDAGGNATVTLTTNRQAKVTARVGSGTSGTNTTLSAEVTVGVNVVGTATLRCQGATTTAANTCSQQVGLPVTFTAERGTTTGAATISSATLEFGDGTSTTLGNLATAATVTHAYSSTGPFTATLTVRDINGELSTSSAAVTVTPRTPLNVSLTATSGTSVVGVGNTTTFTANVTPATELIESYTWDFGDGSTITTSGNTTTHVYTSNGVKRASVTVRTADGRTASASVEFIISGI